MKISIKTLLLLVMLFSLFSTEAQNHMFYAKALNNNINIRVKERINSTLYYIGKDAKIKSIFDNNNIFTFEKPFLEKHGMFLNTVWYIETDDPNLGNIISEELSHIFEFVEYIGDSNDMLAYTPNDYGITGGSNLGFPADLSYYDFIGLPDAFDYTTGSPDIKIGISDAKLHSGDDEFKNKTTILSNESGGYSNGHGTTVTAIAAAQGDNAYGATGVCYDCDIIKTGHSNYNRILELHEGGAKIINCSWGFVGYSSVGDTIVQRVAREGGIIVAASHNDSWSSFPGNRFRYPASYENVISVGAVGSRNELLEGVFTHPGDGSTRSSNVKNTVAAQIGFNGDPNNPNTTTFPYTVHTANLNNKVDIVAPGGAIFRYGWYLLNPNAPEDELYTGLQEEGFVQNYFTSPSTPQVTGTLGLMLTLNCGLSLREAESILKITSNNIDDVPQNNIFHGNYGSGSLHTGKAVKLVNDLLSPNEIAYLENQNFSRWDFEFRGVSEKIEIRNQIFTDSSTLKIVAKNIITIEESSFIEPNSEGYALLEIDPNLAFNTECPNNFRTYSNHSDKSKNLVTSTVYDLYPTKVISTITLEKKELNAENIETIVIYDLFNRKVFDKEGLSSNKIDFDLSTLKRGIYIVKGYTKSEEIVLTEKIIKD